MTFAFTWNTTFLSQPADTEDESLGAQRIRDTKAAVGERLAVDHSLAGDDNDGKHNWVTLPPQASSAPMSIAFNEGRLFTAQVAGVTELFFQDSVSLTTQLTSGGVPAPSSKNIGEMFCTAGTAAPPLCLPCAGAAISRTTYAALFAAIGTLYGVGDGTTTFNLPDCRGRVIAMADSGVGRLTAASLGAAAVAGTAGGNEILQSHTHDVSFLSGSSVTAGAIASSSGAGSSTVHTTSTGTGTSQNVQPTLVVATVWIFVGA